MHFMMRTYRQLCLCLLLMGSFAGAEQDSTWNSTLELAPITVRGPQSKTAASEQTVRDQDLSLRPINNPSDIIKVTPGLYTATHAGGGKAYQYFMRGFDIDHGTDLAFWLDGMPINNVSHGHGQGYTDLYFIIPETIDRLEIYKGPYHARFGNFSTAGALRLRTKSSLKGSSVKVEGGAFNTGRVVALISLGSSDESSPYLAAEVYQSDGPFDSPEDLERYNLMLKVPLLQTSTSELTATGMSYGSGWNASGQIPWRAVEDGSLDRWGSLDPSEGGSSERNCLSLDYSRQTGTDGLFQSNVYFIQYRLGLYSNFTFNLDDPVNGDQIEQRDRRSIFGFNSEYSFNRKLWAMPLTTLVGVQQRTDNIETELGHAVKRRRIGTTVDSEVRESNLGLYVDEYLSPTGWLTLNLGMRGDMFQFDVNDRHDEINPQKTSGVLHHTIGSPKANVVISPLDNLDLFFNLGRGFHSNDARGTVLGSGAVTPLSEALGYEVGVRTLLWNKLHLAADVWRLDLQSELVWIGDAGTTEASGATERMGADFETRWQLLKWVWLDGDVSLSRGIYPDEPEDANTVTNAPPFLINGGVSWRHPLGYYGSVRYNYMADRALNEDESITGEGFQLVNLNVGYTWNRWDFAVQVENLFNVDYTV